MKSTTASSLILSICVLAAVAMLYTSVQPVDARLIHTNTPLSALRCPAGNNPIEGCQPSGPLSQGRCRHFGGVCVYVPFRPGINMHVCCQ
jgi:hypothetical protein